MDFLRRAVQGQRNEVLSTRTLLDGWSRVRRVFYRQLRRDGQWQLQDRDLLDRGHGVSVLLYNSSRGTVLLLRQPRIVATLNGDAFGDTIEVCSGIVETADPLQCALREVEQETGHKLSTLKPLGQIYSSPGSSLEVVSLFVGEYSASTDLGTGGGVPAEGEDIELLEMPLETAMTLIAEGVICDGRTLATLFLFTSSLVRDRASGERA